VAPPFDADPHTRPLRLQHGAGGKRRQRTGCKDEDDQDDGHHASSNATGLRLTVVVNGWGFTFISDRQEFG
jgi:hypothetical protein